MSRLPILIPIFLMLLAPPAADSYEPNDSLTDAAQIAGGAELTSLTLAPAGDTDWFRALLPAGDYRVEALGVPGLALVVEVLGPDGAILDSTDSAGLPTASLSFSVPAEGWYAIHVVDVNDAEGGYVLRLGAVVPAATLLPTATPRLTATPSPSPTADLGGVPDMAEPNYDFATAYRIAPGDVLTDLNFNPGMPGQVDNDFFRMAVRGGVTYQCATSDLGPGVDTNLIAYGGPEFGTVLGGNDDADITSGDISSALSFTPAADGEAFLLVGYKYAELGGLGHPGAATYTLSCVVAQPPTPAPAAFSGPVEVTPSAIRVLPGPADLMPTPAAPLNPTVVDVLVGVDRDGNGVLDPAEGVAGLAVRVLEAATNRELAAGRTDARGALRLAVPGEADLRVSIPYLGASRDLRPGSTTGWELLLPAVNAPGLIP